MTLAELPALLGPDGRPLQRAPRPRPPQPSFASSLTPTTAFPWWLSTTTPVGPTVSESSTLGLAAAWRCLLLIGNAVAGAKLHAYVDDSPVTPRPPLLRRPNALMTPTEFWFAVVYSLLMRGNVYALKVDMDANGWPRQLVLVHPDNVEVGTKGGFPVYRIGRTELDWSEVWHVRWVTVPGMLTGMGVVESHRKGLGIAQAAQDWSLNTFTQGSVPPAVLTAPVPELTATQAATVQADWITAREDNRKPAVLPEGWKVETIAWSPEDAELLASRKMSVAEVAMMFGLDPADLGASLGGSNLTYANVESRELGRASDAYDPVMVRLEDAVYDLLPGTMEARFDRNGRQRMDASTRARVQTARLANGSLTLNEVRRAEGLPEFGPWADQPFANTPTPGGAEPATVPLEQASSAVEVAP